MTIELLMTGDLGPARANPHSIFDHVRSRLHSADIVFGQLEPVLSRRGSAAPQARLAMRSSPDTAQAIRDAGFDVISFASNHCMDWGTEGLLDTLSGLHAVGISSVGAGENIEVARQPVLIESADTVVAFLAYNSILPMGYWADDQRAGCAPMRAWTVHEQIEQDQPGTRSRLHTFAHPEDLNAMCVDIDRLKRRADVVIVSMHWGIHFIPNVIADYQREIAHAAIDAGADAVVGHHPHLLKGVEIYRGKVIFYSLGNFALDPPTSFQKGLTASRRHQEIHSLNPNWKGDDKKLTLTDSCPTAIAKCDITNNGIRSVSMLPAFINDESQPEMLTQDDARYWQVAAVLESACRSQGLPADFQSTHDRILIQAN